MILNLRLVSIPRRYAKNDFIEWLFGERKLFQSLVGTLKTYCTWNEHVTITRFQSLVGTLKTGKTALTGRTIHMFQSLVGTLKTTSPDTAPSSTNPMFQSLVGTLKTLKGRGMK